MKKVLLFSCLMVLLIAGTSSAFTAGGWSPSESSGVNEYQAYVLTLNTTTAALKTSSVTSSTAYVKEGGSCSSGITFGSVSLSATSNTPTSTIKFTPTAAYDSGKQYTLCVKSGGSGLRDTNNGTMSSDATFTFTVRDYALPHVDSYLPNVPIVSATTPNISVTFSEAMAQSTVSTSTVTLLNVTDNINVSLNGPSWSGNVVTFTPSSPLPPLKTYQVTLDGTQKDLSGNLIDCSSHLCSWTFVVDNTPPTVSAYSPAQTYVKTVNPVISASFSQVINQATLTTSSFSLKQGTTSVAGAISYNTGTDTATFIPSAALVNGKTYTVALTTAIKDTASPTPNTLAQPYTWSFIVDVTAPVVASISPSSGAGKVPVFGAIVVTFSDANGMLTQSMNSSTVTVSDGTANAPCTISYDPATKKLTLLPASGLKYSTTYTVTLSSDITDLAGNPLAGTSWTFTTEPVTPNTYTVYPPLMCNTVKPNVLIILDNSNSMDEDMNHYAVGSPFCTTPSDPYTCSKSILARQAISSIINTYGNAMRIGIMSYKLSSIAKNYLHHSTYFASYDRRSYCPNAPKACQDYCVGEDPPSGNGNYTPSANEAACNAFCQQSNSLFQASYRDEILTEKGTNGNNGTAINSDKRRTYCSLIYPKFNELVDANKVTVYYGVPGTMYSSDNGFTRYCFSENYKSTEYSAQTDSYRICSGKTGSSDKYSGYSGCGVPLGFRPTDSDFALGFNDFGQRLFWAYTSLTWFSNSSPGGGYLNVPIADNFQPDNNQLKALLAALGGDRIPPAFQNDEAGYMSCTNTSNPNACGYIVNAGLTPTAGTLQSAIDYFNGALNQGGTVASPIQQACQKNFVIYVTDGLPSVSETGAPGNADALMSAVLGKIDALRCPASPTSANCKVTRNSVNYDVPTYVLGMGLNPADQANLDSMAVHGGTATSDGEARYARNPTELNNALIDIFINLSSTLSSGTSASVLNNKEGSGATALQAVFYPSRSFDGDKTKVKWVGEMQSLWYLMDPNMQNSSIREDTNQDYILDLKQDKIVDFYFDSSQSKARVNWFSDADGSGLPDSATPDKTDTPEKVASLWKAGMLLWKRDISTDPRTVYTGFYSSTGATPQKFSSLSGNGFVTSPTAWDLMQIPAGTNGFRQAKATKLIDYILGADQEPDADGTSYRPRKVTVPECGLTDSLGCTREWKLGDIVSSTPKIVSNFALGSYDRVSPNGYGDYSYSKFLSSATYRKRGMVFVGANDGMLHAFRLGTLQALTGKVATARIVDENGSLATASTRLGREEWSFVPESVLPYLKYYSDSSYDHIFYVDRTPTVFDASIGVSSGCSGDYSLCDKTDGSTWRTVLIGGMGLGGASRPANGSCNSTVNGIPNCIKAPIIETGLSSYFALDVTDPRSPKYLWEFSGDASGTLGAATTGPAIVRTSVYNADGNPDHRKNGKWYAIFASGPTGPIDTVTHQFLGQSDQELKIFVVDIASGAVVKTFNTGLQNAFAGFLSGNVIDTDRWKPDSPGFYSDDVVYIGYTQLDPDNGTWTKGGILRLTTADRPDPAATEADKKWTLSTLISDIGPVTTSISKLQDRQNKNLWIYFGTGRFFYKGDDPSTTVQQRLYGVKEPCYSTASRTVALPLSPGTENHIDKKCTDEVSGTLVDQTGSASTGPLATLQNDSPGWYILLERAASPYLSERVIVDPVATMSGAVFFSTFKPSSDACKFGGDSHMWAVRYDTGGVPPAEAMKGVVLLQTSTGAFQSVSREKAFSNPGNAGLDGRRGDGAVPGLVTQGAQVVSPRPARKILHIKEK